MTAKTFTKTLACFAFILISFTGSGQNRIIRNQGFYYTIEGNVGYGLKMKTDYPPEWDEEYSPYNLGLAISGNYFLNHHVSAGASLGVTHYASPSMTTLPFLGNLKYFFSKAARTPFIYANGGYAFRTDADEQHKGPLYELGLGYRFQLQNRHNLLTIKVGYNYFKANHWEWAPPRGHVWYDGSEPQWYFRERPTINFTVCFNHSVRY